MNYTPVEPTPLPVLPKRRSHQKPTKPQPHGGSERELWNRLTASRGLERRRNVPSPIEQCHQPDPRSPHPAPEQRPAVHSLLEVLRRWVKSVPEQPEQTEPGRELIRQLVERWAEQLAVSPSPPGWAATTQRASLDLCATNPDRRRQALNAVLRAPEEDGPRLAYAQVLRDTGQLQRAELIEAQLRLARKERQAGDLARVRSLLAAHGAEWAREDLGGRLADEVRGVWRRGFLEWLELSAKSLVQHSDALQRQLPLRGLRVTSLGPDMLSLVLSLGVIAAVRALSLRGLAIRDDGAQIIASAVQIRQILWLDLGDNEIGDSGVECLLRSRHMAEVRWVGLHGNPSHLVPRAGGFDAGTRLDTKWPTALRERDLPRWVARLAETPPQWFEVA